MNWLKEVSAASTIPALLSLVNEYLLQHPEEYWSWIPRESRPTLVANVAELHQWHRKLSDDLGRATLPNLRMQDICVFFVRASARALEIEQMRPASPSSNDDSSVSTPAEGNGG